MSGPSYNMPQQPTYGEGMADAMQAQLEMLLGTGEFADIFSEAGFEGGDLADIIREVEAPLRQQTAQTDTDVLRTTLLGTEKQMQVQQDPDTGKFGIAGAEVVTDADGNPQTAGGGRYQMVQLRSPTIEFTQQSPTSNALYANATPGKFAIIDTTTGGIAEEFEFKPKPSRLNERATNSLYNNTGAFGAGVKNNQEKMKLIESFENAIAEEQPAILRKTSASITKLQETIDTGGEGAVTQEFTFTNPNIPTTLPKQDNLDMMIKEIAYQKVVKMQPSKPSP